MAKSNTLDYLSYITGGVGDLGEALGLWDSGEEKAQKLANEQAEKAYERQESRRNAIKAYLEGNLSKFNEPNYTFDPQKFSDILNPIQEQNASAVKGLGNRMTLAGIGRGGVASELQARMARKQNSDVANTLTGLRRTDENTAYQRALQQYINEQNRVKTISAYQ